MPIELEPGTAVPRQQKPTDAFVAINDGAPDTAATIMALIRKEATVSTTTYTFVLADTGRTVVGTNAGAKTFSIPLNAVTAMEVGTILVVRNTSTTNLTVNIATTGTIDGVDNGALIIPPGAEAEFWKRATNDWTGQWIEMATGLTLKAPAAIPPVPPAGHVRLFSRNMGGRLLPAIIGPSGLDTTLQTGLHGNAIFHVTPSSGTTAPSCTGGTLTTGATMSSQQTAGSTNKWSATFRKRFQTSTTAGNLSGMRTAYTQWFFGNAAGYGGFWFRAQFGAQINLNGGQKFIGLCASTGVLAGDPSALLNMCGVGYDAGDASTGNWQFMRNDGSGTATKVDLGANAARGTTEAWDMIMFAKPNSAELFVRIVNINTDVVVLDTSYTTDLPVVNTCMAFKAEVRNGAVAAADNFECSKVYIESDY